MYHNLYIALLKRYYNDFFFFFLLFPLQFKINLSIGIQEQTLKYFPYIDSWETYSYSVQQNDEVFEHTQNTEVRQEERRK